MDLKEQLGNLTAELPTLSAARVAALSALYIGDGLREIAQAIKNAVPLPPTEADLDKKLTAALKVASDLLDVSDTEPGFLRTISQGTCEDCSHFTADPNGLDGMCTVGDSQFSTVARADCWRFGSQSEEKGD